MDVAEQAPLCAAIAVDQQLPKRLPVAIDNVAAVRMQIQHHLGRPGMAELLPQHLLGDLVEPLADAGEVGDQPGVPVHVAEDEEQRVLAEVALGAGAGRRVRAAVLLHHQHHFRQPNHSSSGRRLPPHAPPPSFLLGFSNSVT